MVPVDGKVSATEAGSMRLISSAFPKLLAAHESIAVHQAVLSQIRNLHSPSDRSVFKAMGYTWEDHLNYVIDLKSGESVLLFGASGGIGHLAVQLAKRMGARVLAVASGPDGVALAKRLGADKVIDGHSEDIRGSHPCAGRRCSLH